MELEDSSFSCSDKRSVFLVTLAQGAVMEPTGKIHHAKELGALAANSFDHRFDVRYRPSFSPHRRRVNRAIVDTEAQFCGAFLGNQQDLCPRCGAYIRIIPPSGVLLLPGGGG